MFSRVLRRTHMYLALFLTPWVLMYTVSTMAMNHRGFFRGLYGDEPPRFVLERETAWSGTFPEGATPKQKAAQILAGIGMEGAFGAQESKEGKLTINRFLAVQPRRLTWEPETAKLTIEKQEYRINAFLERMHRRRGYQHDSALEDSWALSVDLFITGMVLWALSGLWMWWELKTTRRWGAAAALGGVGLFAFFVVMI